MSDKILQESTLTAIGQHTRKVINKDIKERKRISRKKQKDFISRKQKRFYIRERTTLGFAIYTNRMRPMMHGCPCNYDEGKRYKQYRHIIHNEGKYFGDSVDTPITLKLPKKGSYLNWLDIFAQVLDIDKNIININIQDNNWSGSVRFSFPVSDYVENDGMWKGFIPPRFTNSSVWKRILCKTVKRRVSYLNRKHIQYKFAIYFIKNPIWNNNNTSDECLGRIESWSGQISNLILDCKLDYTADQIIIEFRVVEI